MTRKRLPTEAAPTLKTLEDVDATLARIGELTRELEAIAADTEETIACARETAKIRAEMPATEKALLERALQDYGGAHRADFAKVRTKELAHGSIGFRLSSKVVIRRIGDTLTALKDYGLKACIRITEAPDKEAMRNLDAATLASVGATLKTEDTFWYELKREDVEPAA